MMLGAVTHSADYRNHNKAGISHFQTLIGPLRMFRLSGYTRHFRFKKILSSEASQYESHFNFNPNRLSSRSFILYLSHPVKTPARQSESRAVMIWCRGEKKYIFTVFSTFCDPHVCSVVFGIFL